MAWMRPSEVSSRSIATGAPSLVAPDITVDVLVPATAVLVPATVLNLVVIARQPVHTVAGQQGS